MNSAGAVTGPQVDDRYLETLCVAVNPLKIPIPRQFRSARLTRRLSDSSDWFTAGLDAFEGRRTGELCRGDADFRPARDRIDGLACKPSHMYGTPAVRGRDGWPPV